MRIVRRTGAGWDDSPDGNPGSAGTVRLARIGQPGQSGDILSGCDVGPDGHLLSVAELQVAYREFYARKRATEPPATSAEADESIALGDTEPVEPADAEAGATGSPQSNVETADPIPTATDDREISPAARALAEALNKRTRARSA